MKPLAIFLLMFLSSFSYAQITPIEFQRELSKADRARALDYLNRLYDGNVTDADLNGNLSGGAVKEYTYWGYFKKVKLLRGRQPMEMFLYSKDGQCNACHESGIAILDENGVIRDSMVDRVSRIGKYLIEYDDKGTCALMTKLDDDHAGGVAVYCSIYRVSGKLKFRCIYKQLLTLNDKFGYDVHIDVNLAAPNSSGYKNLIIKERYNPMAPSKGSYYYNDGDTVPPGYNKDITLQMKNFWFEDTVDDVKSFFRHMFREIDKQRYIKSDKSKPIT